MALRSLSPARLVLAVALVALAAGACAAPTAAPVSPTASPTVRPAVTATQLRTASRTPAPSATASETAAPTRTATKTRTATPRASATVTATPTEAGVGATLPMVYKFLNNCTSDFGAWHITIFGPEEAVVDVPLGETVTGELPPGQYTFIYVADNGAEDGPFGFFSDDGPVNEAMCPEES